MTGGKQTEPETRAWIRDKLKVRYGDKLSRLILAGSRAKRTNRPDSDWDIIAVIEGYRSIWPGGPIRMEVKLNAPDGNVVEVFEVNPNDLHLPLPVENPLILEALEHNIDV